MGRFADDVNARLRDRLASDRPAMDWTTERYVAGTPVDVAGEGDGRLVAVELEWRRADPSDNAAKLFRHLSEGAIDADRVVVVHLFTRHYDLVSGGHSAKRKNAEFVGRMAQRAIDASGEERPASRVAADTPDGLSYHPITFDLDPPKRGADRPEGWQAAADAAAARVRDLIESTD